MTASEMDRRRVSRLTLGREVGQVLSIGQHTLTITGIDKRRRRANYEHIRADGQAYVGARFEGQFLCLDNDAVIEFETVTEGSVRVRIHAPRWVEVLRQEAKRRTPRGR